MNKYDSIVLGAGPAGIACAVRLSQLGRKVAIIERDYIGGICTNWGCTPSKAMIESAKIAKYVRSSSTYGVYHSGMRIDFGRVAERRDGVIRKAREEATELLKHHGIEIFQGEGELIDNHTVRVHHGKLEPDGESMTYHGGKTDLFGETLVIGTGSVPLMPPRINPSDRSLVNSNRLITVRDLPESLIIIGGGVIGLEFATIFSNLGSKVTVIEYQDRLLSQLDPEISTEIHIQLTRVGVKVMTKHCVNAINNGHMRVENLQTNEEFDMYSPRILMAIGRKAVIKKQAFDNAGLDYTDKGIIINTFMQTNLDGVWAIGDATGESILAHVGIQQGILCAENIVALDDGHDLREMDYSVIPTVVYTLPEVACVGNVPENLDDVKVLKVPFSANLRATIEENAEGFVKVWIKDNRLLAAQSIGYVVSEIIQEFANIIALKTPIDDVARIIHAHPTYAEITRTILEHAQGKSVDYYE